MPAPATDDTMAAMFKTVETAMKLKRVMRRRGLTRARAKCPACGNETLQGRLAGPKHHIRMWCETEGCTAMTLME